MRKKIIYIAHPIGGDVPGNLDRIQSIVKHIYANVNLPLFNNVVPLVPYYLDCLVLDDNDPVQRKTGLSNGLQLLSRPGIIDELWLFGPTISPGMREEVLTAFRHNIKVVSTNNLYEQLLQLREEYEKQSI